MAKKTYLGCMQEHRDDPYEYPNQKDIEEDVSDILVKDMDVKQLSNILTDVLGFEIVVTGRCINKYLRKLSELDIELNFNDDLTLNLFANPTKFNFQKTKLEFPIELKSEYLYVYPLFRLYIKDSEGVFECTDYSMPTPFKCLKYDFVYKTWSYKLR